MPYALPDEDRVRAKSGPCVVAPGTLIAFPEAMYKIVFRLVAAMLVFMQVGLQANFLGFLAAALSEAQNDSIQPLHHAFPLCRSSETPSCLKIHEMPIYEALRRAVSI